MLKPTEAAIALALLLLDAKVACRPLNLAVHKPVVECQSAANQAHTTSAQ
jgi:hypothetical protein